MDNGGNAEDHQTQDQQNQNQQLSMNGRGHNGNYSWDFWELGSSRFVDWRNHNNNQHHHQQQQQHYHQNSNNNTSSSSAAAFMFLNQNNQVNNAHPHLHPHHFLHQQSGLYAGGANMHPDPHLTCLKLGKRHYFEDHGPPVVAASAAAALVGDRHVSGFPMMIKRGRSYDDGVLFGGPTSSSSTSSVGGGGGGSSSSTVVIPRCQVEGCHVPLIHAKDYHRRHKVCEMHSKAPKVVVLGAEQRFCQQCSRFHAVSEFDDSKRSCRRRLAGHNERRRKSTSNDSLAKNSSQETSRSMEGRFSYISPSNGRALSLLSSSKSSSSWVSPADISTRSSAALRELIAENRAATALARQLIFDQNWQQNGMDSSGRTDRSQVGDLSQIPLQHQVFPAEASEWDRFQGSETHVTLDLMQAPSSPFGFLAAGRSKSKEEHEEECCEIWKSLEGTHVV